jgi:hypothetical protein
MATSWTTSAGTRVTVDVSVTTTRSKTGATTTAEWYTDCSAHGRLGSYTGSFTEEQPRKDASNLAFDHIRTCPGA